MGLGEKRIACYLEAAAVLEAAERTIDRLAGEEPVADTAATGEPALSRARRMVEQLVKADHLLSTRPETADASFSTTREPSLAG